MFVEDHREALVRLLADPSIPEEFYWHLSETEKQSTAQTESGSRKSWFHLRARKSSWSKA